MRRFIVFLLLLSVAAFVPGIRSLLNDSFAVFVVVPQCEHIVYQSLPDNIPLTREYIEKEALRGFRIQENPEKYSLHIFTEYKVDELRKTNKEFHIVAYYKYRFFRCFEIVYSRNGRDLAITSVID